MYKRLNLVGQRFERLIVISFIYVNKHGFTCWRCLCICGNYRIVIGNNLKSGHTKSCGCLQKELSAKRMKIAATKHGHSSGGNLSPTYYSWHNMIQRCTNPKEVGYKYYGGRGIKVCDRWRNSFENFLKDMGERPENLTLDRIDNNGDYELENCCWATRKEQANNRRNNVKLTYKNITLNQKTWSRILDIPLSTLREKMAKGVTLKTFVEQESRFKYP